MIRFLCLLALLATSSFCQESDDSESAEMMDKPEKDMQKEEKKTVSFMEVFETCKKPFVTENYNPNWEKELFQVNENTTQHYVLMSKGDIYRITQNLYGVKEFDTFKESHFKDSCIRFKKDKTGTLFSLMGYNDKKFVMMMNPILSQPNCYYFLPQYPTGFGGRAYISLSDNKHFTVYVFCSDDGLGSFAVTSPEKTISPDVLNIAKEHLKALGFKEENFVEPNYEIDCDSPLEDVPMQKNYTFPPFISNMLYVPPRFHPNLLFPFKK